MLKHFLQQTSTKFNGMKQIYRSIHQNGPITKSKLIKISGMKQTTVARYLEELMEEGFIRIGQYEASSGGRPPALYEIDPRAGFMIGIDLSRIDSTISLVDMAFQPVDSYTFPMTEDHTPEYTIPLLIEKTHDLLREYKISEELLLGIGVGTVGPLDRKKGLILDPGAFIASGWRNVPIVQELESAFDQKVLLENGANVATLHEYIQNPVSNRTILYCISGRGLRCGVLTDGHIMQNKTGDVSSFGEMVIDLKNRRSLSSLISHDYLLEEAERRILAGEKSTFNENLDRVRKRSQMDHFIQALQKGDPLIQDVVLQSGYSYGVGIANMANVLHPEQVVLNSELMRIYPPYYEKVVETAKQYIYRFERQPTQFMMANRMENSIIIGASVLVFQSYF